MSKHSKIFIIFLLTLSIAFAFLERAALANFVQNAWQGYKLTEGLVGYWSFDGKDIDLSQVTGEVRDRSGQGNNGDWASHATTTTIGKIGQAIDFDGVDDRVSMGAPSVLNITGPLSISGWIYPTSYGGGARGRLVDKDTSLTGGYWFSVDNSNVVNGIGFGINGGINGTEFLGVANVITLNKWQYISATLDANKLVTLYVDGVSVGSATLNALPATSADNFVIGGRTTDNARNFAGTIDDVRVYSRTLSPDEVKRLYLMGASLKTNVTHRDELIEDLVGYWTFDGANMDLSSSTKEILDASGQNNNGNWGSHATTTTIGKIGQAISFDGVDDFIDGGDIAAIDTATALTICAWVKHDDDTSDDTIAEKIVPPTTGPGFLFWKDDVAFLSGRTNTYSILVTDSVDSQRVEGATGAARVNVWTHVCMTFRALSSTGLRLYVNGIEDANSPQSVALVNGINAGTNVFAVGKRISASGLEFGGAIDDMRIYTRALSADEIKRLYLMGASLKTNTAHRDELTEGLVDYWSFDGKDIDLSQATAEVRDRSGQGNNGDWTSHATTTTIGKIGQAIDFDGVNDYVTAGDQSSLEINGNPLSFGGWFKISALPSGNREFLITKGGTSGSYEYEASINGSNSNKLRFSVYDSSGVSAYIFTDSTSIPTTGQWFHIMAVYDNTGPSAKIYYNGVLEGTSNSPVGSIHTSRTSKFDVGKRDDGAETFLNGAADEIRIYNRVLSADEVRRLYLMGQ